MGETEDRADTRWVSYTELAKARGISRESAIRIARRRKWPKREGNDGTIRVAVPLTDLTKPEADLLDIREDIPQDIPEDISRIISGLEGRLADKDEHIASLQEWLAGAEGRVQAAESRAEKAEALVRELGEGKAAAEATAKARLEEIERLNRLLNAGLLARLRGLWGGR
jgi:hypothetical protein